MRNGLPASLRIVPKRLTTKFHELPVFGPLSESVQLKHTRSPLSSLLRSARHTAAILNKNSDNAVFLTTNTMSQIMEIVRNKWGTLPAESTESFTGRTILITGATSGLGYAAAVKFAKLGASKIIITARDETKGEAVKTRLLAEVGEASEFEVWTLDMNSYDSITQFTQRIDKELEHLDVAILNAGVFNTSYETSGYGWEEDLQVNTLSTTLLGILLLPKLKKSKTYTGKIPILQFVNSGAHKTVEIPVGLRAQEPSNILTELNKPDMYKGAMKQYASSKLLQRYAAIQLAKAIPSSEVIITCVCPGMVVSDISRHIQFPGVKIVTAVAHALLFRTADQGANVYVSGAAQNQELHGRFWASDVIEPDTQSIVGEENEKVARKVWNEIVEELGKHVPDVRERI
jgi:NAD(P)-dependent dehydrogenase (short-subunit alcohol dehydrogenase family)